VEFSGARVSFDWTEFSGARVCLGAVFSGGQVSFEWAKSSGEEVSFAGAGFSGGKVDLGKATFTVPPTFDAWPDGNPPAGLILP
jgi:hypothetical protein